MVTSAACAEPTQGTFSLQAHSNDSSLGGTSCSVAFGIEAELDAQLNRFSKATTTLHAQLTLSEELCVTKHLLPRAERKWFGEKEENEGRE